MTKKPPCESGAKNRPVKVLGENNYGNEKSGW